MTYVNALSAGLVAGGAYGAANDKATAPPTVALAGLLGIVAGEVAGQPTRNAPHRRTATDIFDHQPGRP